MRKLDFFRLPAPRCAGMAAGAGSLKKSNFLMFSKVLRKGADQAKYTKIWNGFSRLKLAFTYFSIANKPICRTESILRVEKKGKKIYAPSSPSPPQLSPPLLLCYIYSLFLSLLLDLQLGSMYDQNIYVRNCF